MTAYTANEPLAPRLLDIIRTQTEIAKLGLDLDSVMNLVAERAQQLTHAQGAVVELVEGDQMIYRASSGIAEPHLGLRLARESSLSGLCVARGVPLRCEDTEDDERVDREACRLIGLRSLVAVPLLHHHEVVGVLKVMSDQPDRFDADDVQVLQLMSELIAAAMYHASRSETGELFRQATHDAMTGLPNRALYFDRLRQCLADARRNDLRFAVLNLDMDDLKPINDQHGHRAGDAAIAEVARRIEQTSRPQDTVARVGGDEFGVLLNRADDFGNVIEQAMRLGEAITQPFEFEGIPLTLDASVGIALYPDDGHDLTTLLDHADRAMYTAKRAKRHPT